MNRSWRAPNPYRSLEDRLRRQENIQGVLILLAVLCLFFLSSFIGD
jgi:hypothetical protein